MAKAKFYGTGRRKKSVARVYLVPGTGNITINKRDIDEYLGLETLKVVVRQPLVATETADKFDVIVNVKGGGYTGHLLVAHHSSANVNFSIKRTYKREDNKPRKIKVFRGFLYILTRKDFL